MKAQDPAYARLTELRNGLLALHKTLLESERDSYERSIERITSSNQYLGLVLHDPWFAWLRELSQMVVFIDEIQDSKEQSPTAADADVLVAKARALLLPSEAGAGFQKGYFDAMQRDPGVVLAHGRMMKILSGLTRQL